MLFVGNGGVPHAYGYFKCAFAVKVRNSVGTAIFFTEEQPQFMSKVVGLIGNESKMGRHQDMHRSANAMPICNTCQQLQ
jgi:hypothetical protein